MKFLDLAKHFKKKEKKYNDAKWLISELKKAHMKFPPNMATAVKIDEIRAECSKRAVIADKKLQAYMYANNCNAMREELELLTKERLIVPDITGNKVIKVEKNLKNENAK